MVASSNSTEMNTKATPLVAIRCFGEHDIEVYD